jgi:hypothetical protein
MQDDANLAIPTPKRVPWNKGKLIGAKPPLRQKHVWAIRTMLQVERSKRDLAMFNLASTVNCGAAMLSPSGSMTLLPMVTQLIGQRCVRERPGDPFDLS